MVRKNSDLPSVISILFVFLIILVVYLFPRAAHAAPAGQNILEITQPNGKIIKVRVKGDEWNNWIKTVDGYSMKKDNDGFWYYIQSFDGDAPILTDVYAHEPPPDGLTKHMHAKRKINQRIKTFKRKKRPVTPDKIRGRAYGQFTGKLLFILTEFADQRGKYSEADFAASIAKINDYYHTASYGKVTLSPADETYGTDDNGVIGWINVGYNHPNTSQNEDISSSISGQQLTRDAVISADPYINFKEYDINNDGYVDADELAVVIIVAGYDCSLTPECIPNIWPHQSSFCYVEAPVMDGVIIGDDHNDAGGYAQVAERQGTKNWDERQSTFGVMAHESGHLIFRLPDLYDTDYSSQGVGLFCIMGQGNYGRASNLYEYPGETPVLPCAWVKYILGWVEGAVVSGSVNIQASGSPSASSSNTVYRLVTSNPDECFLVENRQPLGYDSGLKDRLGKDFGGLAIWHIDESQINNDSECLPLCNCSQAHCKVALEQADGLWGLEKNDETNIYYDFMNCIIADNVTEDRGGGMYCKYSSPTIEGCKVHDNSAKYGGGIYNDTSSPNIFNSSIFENSAINYGGGIRCTGLCSPTISYCDINNNSCNNNGGGIACNKSSPEIINCAISKNSAIHGGGMYYYECSSPSTIINCIFNDNTSQYGGGVHSRNSSLNFTNCTFYKNLTDNNGGGIYCSGPPLITIKNCILWDDAPEEIYTDSNASLTVSYSDVRDEYSGEGNINDDPLFVDPNEGNYHLQAASPCIDKGINTNAPIFDKDAIPRSMRYGRL